MRKPFVIFGIALLLAVGLSGCTEENPNAAELQKLVGTWQKLDNGTLSNTDIYVFKEDGTCTKTNLNHEGTYTISNETLVITLVNSGVVYNYEYSLIDDTTLVLINIDDPVPVAVTYSKQ